MAAEGFWDGGIFLPVDVHIYKKLISFFYHSRSFSNTFFGSDYFTVTILKLLL